MDELSAFAELLQGRGRSLSDIGLNETGLPIAVAREALGILRRGRVAVLGGDIYRLVGERPESRGDNWYCSPQTGEADSDFAARSIRVAEEYLARFPEAAQFIAVIVVDRRRKA